MARKRKVLQFAKDKSLEEKEEKTPQVFEEEKARKRFLSTMSLASELGFSISLPIAGGALLGQFLDSKFQTSPRLTLSLIFLGVILGFTNIYFLIKKEL